MIQVHELMIGNYLLNPEGEICEVSEIKQEFSDSPYDIVLKDSDGMFCDYRIEDLKALPITEDRLLQFGFKKTSAEFKQYGNGKIGIYLDSDGVASYGIAKAKFVHQFQNLCFALTEKPLKIKL